MTKTLTCIICPNGCNLEITYIDGAIQSISGELCKRGIQYAEQELTNPQRNIATSVSVVGGHLPLASVRLSAPIPKNRIFDVMEEIKKVKVCAPVKIGQIVIEDVLNLKCDVVITKNVSTTSNSANQ